MIRPRTRGGGRESATIRGAQSYLIIFEKMFVFGSGWGSFLFSFICLFPMLGLWVYWVMALFPFLFPYRLWVWEYGFILLPSLGAGGIEICY
jgi:hypothetical protein